MSFDPARRALLGGLLWGAGAAALAGCGFRPLYGEGSAAGGGEVEAQLAEVLVLPLPDRPGQMMHNMLIDRLNPLGQPARPRYALTASLSESIREIGLQEDETASRANLTVDATFTLTERTSGRLLYRGRARSVNSYDILENQFASQVAENEARRRGITQVADEIKERLGVYFAVSAEGAT